LFENIFSWFSICHWPVCCQSNLVTAGLQLAMDGTFAAVKPLRKGLVKVSWLLMQSFQDSHHYTMDDQFRTAPDCRVSNLVGKPSSLRLWKRLQFRKWTASRLRPNKGLEWECTAQDAELCGVWSRDGCGGCNNALFSGKDSRIRLYATVKRSMFTGSL